MSSDINMTDNFYSCKNITTAKVASLNLNMNKKEFIDYDTDFNPKIDIYGEDINGKHRINYTEFNLQSDVKCFYKINFQFDINRDDRVRGPNLISVNSKFFSNICTNLNNDINFIKKTDFSVGDSPQIFFDAGGGKKKFVENKFSELGYIWQKGECSLDSEKYFKEINATAVKQKLLENKFILIADGNRRSLFYANPGLIIKVEKDSSCSNTETCEMHIIMKKQLSSAIFNDQGLLFTSDYLYDYIYDKDDCDLVYLQPRNTIVDKFKFLLCKSGLIEI